MFAPQTASLLIGAVAVSMLLSPLLLVAMDKLLLPRYANCNTPELAEISEPQEAPVIVAGFGRYGQIVSRMLLAQGIPCTVLDHDAQMIEAARSFGYRVFYCDATRMQRELFESSLRSARSVLELLGQSEQEARQAAQHFRAHNLALFEQLHPHYKDQAKLIAVVKQGRRQLEEQMAAERAQRTVAPSPARPEQHG